MSAPNQFAQVSAGISPGLVHLSATAAMAARRDQRGVIAHLRVALDAGVSRTAACEALGYLLLPCGDNVLIDAVAARDAAARRGELVPPHQEKETTFEF